MASNENDEKDSSGHASPIASDSGGNTSGNASSEEDEKQIVNVTNIKQPNGDRKRTRSSLAKRQQSAPHVTATVTIPTDNTKKNNNKNNNNNNSNNNNNNNNNNNKHNNSNNSAHSNNSPTISLSGSDNEDNDKNEKKPMGLIRAATLPARFDPCREFDNFAGDWVDSKGQPVLISAWGVIRYPNNPKLRFEAEHMGPNHLSVTFDRDPKKRKFVGKLNHDCNVLIWSNDTRWTRKGTKPPPEPESGDVSDASVKTPISEASNDGNNTPSAIQRQGSCLVM